MTTKKTISFQMNPEIKILYAWPFAHRQARRGAWHIEAIDRMRFQRKIEKTQNILDSVLFQHINNIKVNSQQKGWLS